jgi:hypothetical protein
MDLSTTISELKSAKLQTSLLETCLEVTSIVEKLEVAQCQFLTIGFFCDRVQKDKSVNEVFAALNILSTSHFSIFSAHGFLTLPDHPVYILEDEDFADFLSTSRLVSPISGELVEDATEKVSIFYQLRWQSGADYGE